MWGECIIYMPATDSAKRMSNEYFTELKQQKENIWRKSDFDYLKIFNI